MENQTTKPVIKEESKNPPVNPTQAPPTPKITAAPEQEKATPMGQKVVPGNSGKAA